MMNQQQSLTLSDVQQKFELWRSNKSHMGEKIPDSLWVLVHELLKMSSYKRSIIGRKLGISTRQLKEKFPTLFKPKQASRVLVKKSNKRFVEAPLTTLMTALPANHLTVERPDGMKLTVSMFTHEQFSTLIENFME